MECGILHEQRNTRNAPWSGRGTLCIFRGILWSTVPVFRNYGYSEHYKGVWCGFVIYFLSDLSFAFFNCSEILNGVFIVFLNIEIQRLMKIFAHLV